MRRTPSRTLRCAVEAAKVAVVCVITAFAVAPTVAQQPQSATAPATDSLADIATNAHVDGLMRKFGCSPTGLGPDVIPGSALVERDHRVQQVSFDDGWAVHTGDAEGSLVAVCRAELRG